MPAFLRDLRYAARSLARAKPVTITAILTLALSIGLTTAVFGVVDAVLLRPLDVPDPDRLVAICEREGGEAEDWCGASVPNLVDLGERSRTIAVVGAARSWPFVLRTREGSEGVNGGLATPEAFEAAGVRVARGRLLRADDMGEGWRRVVVLGDAEWRTRFGAREDMIGSSVTLDGEPHEVVGILAPGSAFPRLEGVGMWRPIHFDPRSAQRRDWRGFRAYARLRPEASLDQARAELATIAADLRREHFPQKARWTLVARPWLDVIVGPVRGTMRLVGGAVAFVLLIGCANVANLLLVRAAGRRREVAVRAALGASRARLAREMLAESLVLAAAGGALGLVLGWWAQRAFVALAPSGIPRLDGVGMDVRVFAFTGAVVLLTTLLAGVAPALGAAGGNLLAALAEGGRAGSGRRTRRLGAMLIVSEIALAVVLVAGAGLMGRSFATLARWEPGFEQEHVLTAWTLASQERFDSREDVAAFLRRTEGELASLPGVVAVSTASAGPLFGGDGAMTLSIDGREAPADGARWTTLWYDVAPGYFRTLGLPVVRGRELDESDRTGGPLVAVVNETFVRRYLGDGDPLGRRVRLLEHDTTATIVGVVRDVPAPNPGEAIEPQLFWSNRQIPRPANYLVLRTTADPAGLAASLRARLRAVDPDLQVGPVRTMRDWLDESLVRPRFGAVLLGTFGALALVLAAIGTYGLLAWSVAQETRAIGIRLALGARPASIVAAVVRRGVKLATLGAALGLAGALGMGRFLQAMLAGTSAADPLTLAASVAVLLVAACLACLVPARRASRVDPLRALRAD
jgi:putative ABC transport system permease protein